MPESHPTYPAQFKRLLVALVVRGARSELYKFRRTRGLHLEQATYSECTPWQGHGTSHLHDINPDRA